MYNQFSKYETPSPFGGVYSLKFIEEKDEMFYFKVTNPDHEQVLGFSAKEVKKKVKKIENNYKKT